MKDGHKLLINDDDRSYPSKRKRIGFDNSRSLQILIIILFILIFAGGIFYFLGKRPTEEVSLLQPKVSALEEKMAEFEKQLAELQGKVSTSGIDPALFQRMDALTQRVETLEKQRRPSAESKAKPSVSSKPAVSKRNQYHTVQQGETLFRISKRYRINMKELRKLNNLSEDQPLRIGQKLLVSPRR